ncbi:MAG TPA: hypothetical protein VFW31_16730 [Candidatus Angelobacter sp.]|nr:hypothetical protein [Candidatus Angelobacter sp.]
MFFLIGYSQVGSVLQSAPTAMTHEETIVRIAYAKLAYATQINSIKGAVEDSLLQEVDSAILASRIANGAVSFQFGHIQVGDFSEIANIPYGELVTKPNGEAILPVATGFWVYTTDAPRQTKAATASASWVKAPILGEDWTVSFAAAIRKAQAAGKEDLRLYKRYAAISVTATYDGQSRSYRSLFLFGTDPSGLERVLPVDTVVGGPALTFFLNNSVYPAVLFEPEISKIGFVSQWLRSNAITGIGAGQVQCDIQSLKCSVAAADVTRVLGSLMKPVHKRRARLVEASFHPAPKGLFWQATSCSSFNTTGGSSGATQVDSGDHVFGGHNMSYVIAKSCAYANAANSNGLCNTSCSDTINGTPNESGQVISACHVTQISQQVGGTASGTGAGANCNASVALGVKACLFCMCNVSFSVTGSGATVTITSDGFYTAQQNDSNNCAAQTQPTPAPSPTPSGGGGGGLPPDPCLNGATVNSGPSGDLVNNVCSPIIIDTTGKGFQLTSAADGVFFDIRGDNHPVKLGWTATGSGNAFLALPPAGGVVTNGTQLFGNFTPQPASARPNGFAALAIYDQPNHGGNGDGFINQNDQIFSSLRLWIDLNHDGVCQASELHTLPEFGIASINLKYIFDHRVDRFGNVFRYKANINYGLAGQDSAGRSAYDVFLTAE